MTNMCGVLNGMNGTVYKRIDDVTPTKNGPSLLCFLISGLCLMAALTIYYIVTGSG
jgi:hypothetical protein